ncbi:uncharacterized protein LOC129612010 [Condylostylus longicornis]|uniref:uncharacterized protein LOC129612010 n=1 Tax=Condylostylus longicornis TaxID=2530218 RepID=UPI00244DDDF1|nr:uncharacterized protein LOC129612010 [Condylostylus longicornis]
MRTNFKKFRNDKHRKQQQNNDNIGGLVDSATYIRTSIPLRIFQCIRKLSILRCMKIFLLQKMESKANFTNTGNLTKDFMEQFFNEDKNYPSLTDKRYKNVSDTELTNRLIFHFQKFFKDRDIKLHFIPGVMVQVVPSTENRIKLTVKNNKNVRVSENDDSDYTDIITARRKDDKIRKKNKNKKHNYKHTMIQMAVPVLMMPAILLGTFLPFMLPAFKMATIMSALLNKGALLAALLYAARTTALNNDSDIIHYAYNHPGYH